MPSYDYALIRAVDVATGDAVTLGVVLSCRQARYLGVRWVEARTSGLGLDAELLTRAQAGFARIAEGGPGAGPVGRLPPSERFHFLTAVRSTALQTAPVRTGLAADPEAALDRIARHIGPALLRGGGTPPPAPRV